MIALGPKVEATEGAPIACLGAGTGLGECFLTLGPSGDYECYPSEGGHAEWAPRGCGSDETQLELLKVVRSRRDFLSLHTHTPTRPHAHTHIHAQL